LLGGKGDTSNEKGVRDKFIGVTERQKKKKKSSGTGIQLPRSKASAVVGPPPPGEWADR